MEEEKKEPEIITLLSSGSILGIPGEHGAGTYRVDYAARTIEPVDPVAAQEAQETSAQPEAVQSPVEIPTLPTVPTSQGIEQEVQHLEQEIQTLASEEPHQVQ